MLKNEYLLYVKPITFLLIVLSATLSACADLEDCLHFSRQTQATPTTSAEPLPSSMKGYELYSWIAEEGDGWRYTLVTGTNRLKTVEEITADENKLTGNGWVKITVTGLEDLKEQLKRLPPGTELTWRGGGWLESTGEATAKVMLPEPSLVEAIQDHCRQLDIHLQLSQ